MQKFLKKNTSGGTILIISIFFVNIINFIFYAYLGRVLSFETFGLVTLINTMWYLVLIPCNAMYGAVNQKAAYLIAQKNVDAGIGFLQQTNKKNLSISIVISLFWILLIPFIDNFFQINNFLIPLLFTPVIIMAVHVSADKGFLQGNFNFTSVAIIILVESLSKLVFAWFFVSLHMQHWVYTSIPLSVLVSLLIALLIIRKRIQLPTTSYVYAFPKQFFVGALVTGLSSIALLTFDVLLAKHFLPPIEAGQYALLSLIGKMVYFFGTLPCILIISYVSKDLGNHIDPKRSFYKLFSATVVLSLSAFLGLGLMGHSIVPILFGPKTDAIITYLTTYSAAITLFAISGSIIGYHLAKQQYLFPILAIFMAFLMCLGIIVYHENIAQITQVLLTVGVISIFLTLLLHVIEAYKLFNFNERWFELRYE